VDAALESADSGGHYEHAAIVEAIATFETKPLSTAQMGLLFGFADRLRGEYPASQARHLTTSQSGPTPALTGYVLSAPDGKQVVQAKPTGLSFSRLSPYDRWETFIAEAQRVWRIFQETVGVIELSFFAVRYINELMIPLGRPLYQFFNVYPAVPDKETLFNNLFLKIRYELEGLPATVETIMTPRGFTDDVLNVAVLLDNDITFRIREEAKIWENLGKIREMKNAVFESQITDELRKTLS
jgi:uncharacterized protein (TIGR04255 family)